MNSRNKDWFVRSSAWLYTSRALQRMGGTFPVAIDVSVTPLNYDHSGWRKLGEVRIRYHGTAEDKGNFFHVIQNSIYDTLVAAMGKTIADVLIHEDLLPQIDRNKLAVIRKKWTWGGGYPFVLICKDPHRYPELIEFWQQHPDIETYAELFETIFAEHEQRANAVIDLDKVSLIEVPRLWVEHYKEYLEEHNQPIAADTVRNWLVMNPETL